VKRFSDQQHTIQSCLVICLEDKCEEQFLMCDIPLERIWHGFSGGEMFCMNDTIFNNKMKAKSPNNRNLGILHTSVQMFFFKPLLVIINCNSYNAVLKPPSDFMCAQMKRCVKGRYYVNNVTHFS